MPKNLEELYKKFELMEADMDSLRFKYAGKSKSYAEALVSLKELTLRSSEAAKKAANSTEQSKIAAENSMNAAKEASLNPLFLQIVQSSANAAVAAAIAAIESSAAAASAAAAAAAAVSYYADEYLLQASSEAATASRIAAQSAADAVKLSNQARDIVDSLKFTTKSNVIND